MQTRNRSVRVAQSSTFYNRLRLITLGVGIIILILVTLVCLNAWIGTLIKKLDFDVDIPIPVVNVTIPETPEEEPCSEFIYAIPFVCGESLGFDSNHTVVAADEYAFTMFVYNPQNDSVTFTKRVSMTSPPGDQTPGQVFPSPGNDTLEDGEALEMNCNQIRDLAVFILKNEPLYEQRQQHHTNTRGGNHMTAIQRHILDVRDTGPLLKGVVAVTSPSQLKIWGVQTSARYARLEDTNIQGTDYVGLTRTDSITFDKEMATFICF